MRALGDHEPPSDWVEPSRVSVLGAGALRAYVLVYVNLAFRAHGRFPKRAMDALRRTLLDLPFPEGGPSSSEATSGYDASADVLWVRAYRALFSGMHSAVVSDLETQELLFQENRTLQRKLLAFIDSAALRQWKRRPLRVNRFSKRDKTGLTRLLGVLPATIPFRGVLIVGSDRDVEPGVVRMGVRPDDVDAGWNGRLRYALLRFPAGALRTFWVPAVPVEAWLQRWSFLRYANFAGNTSSFNVLIRVLLSCFGASGGRAWTIAEDSVGSVLSGGGATALVAVLSSPDVSDEREREVLSREIDDVFLRWDRMPSKSDALLFVSAAPPAVVREGVLEALAGRKPDDTPRCLLLCRDELAGLAASFPWVVVAFGNPGQPEVVCEAMLSLVDAYCANGRSETAVAVLQWALIEAHGAVEAGTLYRWFQRLAAIRKGDPWGFLTTLTPLLPGFPKPEDLTRMISIAMTDEFLRSPAWATLPAEGAQESLTRVFSYMFEHGYHQIARILASDFSRDFGDGHQVTKIATTAFAAATRAHPVTARVGG